MAVMDQQECTKRSERSASRQLLENFPALDGKTVAADALHCQVETAQIIAEKSDDFLFQIKAN